MGNEEEMKILDSFMVDNVEEKRIVKLVQLDTIFPLKHIYIVAQERTNPFKYIFFTKFFARRMFNQLKNGYKSCWLEYGVYETGGSDAK